MCQHLPKSRAWVFSGHFVPLQVSPMAIHVEILAAKLSQHYYLDGLAVTALLLLMTAGFLVPKDSPLDQWTGLAHTEQPLLLCLAVSWVCWVACFSCPNGKFTGKSLLGICVIFRFQQIQGVLCGGRAAVLETGGRNETETWTNCWIKKVSPCPTWLIDYPII